MYGINLDLSNNYLQTRVSSQSTSKKIRIEPVIGPSVSVCFNRIQNNLELLLRDEGIKELAMTQPIMDDQGNMRLRGFKALKPMLEFCALLRDCEMIDVQSNSQASLAFTQLNEDIPSLIAVLEPWETISMLGESGPVRIGQPNARFDLFIIEDFLSRTHNDSLINVLRVYFESVISTESSVPVDLTNVDSLKMGDHYRERRSELVALSHLFLRHNKIEMLQRIVPSIFEDRQLFLDVVASPGIDCSQLLPDGRSLISILETYVAEDSRAKRILEAVLVNSIVGQEGTIKSAISPEIMIAIINGQPSREIDRVTSALDQTAVISLFCDIVPRSLNTATKWMNASPSLAPIVGGFPDQNGQLWATLNLEMMHVIGKYKMADQFAKNIDVVGALYSHFSTQFDVSSQRLSKPATETILGYLHHRRDLGSFLHTICPNVGLHSGARLWNISVALNLIDPSDSQFVLSATQIATRDPRGNSLHILEFVNPPLYTFYKELNGLALDVTTGTTPEKIHDLVKLLQAVTIWDDGVLKVNLGRSGFDLINQGIQNMLNRSVSAEMNKAWVSLFTCVVNRVSPENMRYTALLAGNKTGFNSAGYFLIEKVLVAKLPIKDILDSDIPFLPRDNASLCRTDVPLPFLAVVSLDSDSTVELLTVFPEAVRQVSGTKMTIAQMAVKGLADTISRKGMVVESDIDRFIDVLVTCLRFGLEVGLDLRNPIDANLGLGIQECPYALSAFLDGYLNMISPEQRQKIDESISECFECDSIENNAYVLSQFPYFSRPIRDAIAADPTIQDIVYLGINPLTSANTIYSGNNGIPDIGTQMLWHPTFGMDLSTRGSNFYYRYFEQAAAIFSGVSNGDPTKIAQLSNLVDECVYRFPEKPRFSTEFIIRSLIENDDFLAHLEDGHLSERLIGLRQLYRSSEDEIVGEHPYFQSSILALHGMSPEVKQQILPVYLHCMSVPLSLFTSITRQSLSQLELSDMNGALVIPRILPTGETICGVKIGNAIAFSKVRNGRFEPILDKVQVLQNIHQIVVFDAAVTSDEISRGLRFFEKMPNVDIPNIGRVLGIEMSEINIDQLLIQRGNERRHIPVSVNETRFVLESKYEINIPLTLDSHDSLSLVSQVLNQKNVSLEALAFRWTCLYSGDNGLFFEARLKCLGKALELPQSETVSASDLESKITFAMTSSNRDRFDQGLALLEMLSGVSVVGLQSGFLNQIATVSTTISQDAVVVISDRDNTKIGSLIELEDRWSDSGGSRSSMGPEWLFIDESGPSSVKTSFATSVKESAPVVKVAPVIRPIGTGGNTCWLETMVNVEAVQGINALGGGLDEFPPMIRMIVMALPLIDRSKISEPNMPKLEWMIQFLDYVNTLWQAPESGGVVPILSLSEGWEKAFGEPLHSCQETDRVAKSVADFISECVSPELLRASGVFTGIYIHPFESLDVVRSRLDEGTLVAELDGHLVVRVMPSTNQKLLAGGIHELSSQPQLYWEETSCVSREGLGKPYDDRILRHAEAILPFTAHSEDLPATLQLRFASGDSTFLKPSDFNPHVVDGALVFPWGGALYAVSSLLGQPGGHWETLFTDRAIPKPGCEPVFYEKPYNNANATPKWDATWPQEIKRYFSQFPSVVVRASRVPDAHKLVDSARRAGLLDPSSEESVLRGIVQEMMPTLTTSTTVPVITPVPMDTSSFTAMVDEYKQKWGIR